jgi:hypothetical protein
MHYIGMAALDMVLPGIVWRWVLVAALAAIAVAASAVALLIFFWLRRAGLGPSAGRPPARSTSRRPSSTIPCRAEWWPQVLHAGTPQADDDATCSV